LLAGTVTASCLLNIAAPLSHRQQHALAHARD